MKEHEIVLGNRYRDRVTLVEGVAIGMTRWFTGCSTVGLAQPVQPDGKVPDVCWFDYSRLDEADSPAVVVEKTPKTGGPQPSPQMANRR